MAGKFAAIKRGHRDGENGGPRYRPEVLGGASSRQLNQQRLLTRRFQGSPLPFGARPCLEGVLRKQLDQRLPAVLPGATLALPVVDRCLKAGDDLSIRRVKERS